MKTILELQQMASRLRSVTEVESISPEETFGLLAEVLTYLADLEQNVHGLGIRNIYESRAAMVADGMAPVGSDGRVLRFGQLVAVYSVSGNQAENGNIYAWQGADAGTKWLLMGNVSDVGTVLQWMAHLGDLIAEMERAQQVDADRLLSAEGYITSLQSVQTSLQSALTSLQSSLNAEVTARQQTDSGLSALQSSLNAEVSARQQTDLILTGNDAEDRGHHTIRFAAVNDEIVTVGDAPDGWVHTAAQYTNVAYAPQAGKFCYVDVYMQEGQYVIQVFDAGSLWNDPATGHPYAEKLYLSADGGVYRYVGNALLRVGGEEKKVYLTQSEYDALVLAGQVDAGTEYNIYEEEEE